MPLEKTTEMVARKVIAGHEILVGQSYFKKGTLVPLHAHASEIFLYVLQGAVRLHVAGEDVTAREGEVLLVPAGAIHQAEALDDSFVLSVVKHEGT